MVVPLITAVVASFLIPLFVYPLIRRKFGVADAAAVAATYGSVSAVTFMTSVSYLEARGTPFGGYMVAALALMESSAILTGLILARMNSAKSDGQKYLGDASFMNVLRISRCWFFWAAS